MSDDPKAPQGSDPTRPRRPFEDAPRPVSFVRSPEFQRLVWFGSLLVFVLLFALYLLQNAAHVETATTARAPKDATAESESHKLTPAELEARRTKLSTLFEGSLNDTQNSEKFRETEGYCRLLQLLSSYTPEEVSTRATRHLDYHAAIEDPDAWRGEFITARGVIVYMYAKKLERRVFGISDVYRGFITEADGSEGIAFDLIQPPPAFENKVSPVDIEGIFYRTVMYETENTRPKEAPFYVRRWTPLAPMFVPRWVRVVPYVLARNMRVVANAHARSTGFLSDHGGTLLVLMGLAIFIARLLMYAFQRRARRRAPARPIRTAGFHEMFEHKLRDEGRSPHTRPPA
jgi:hypothetical protein